MTEVGVMLGGERGEDSVRDKTLTVLLWIHSNVGKGKEIL